MAEKKSNPTRRSKKESNPAPVEGRIQNADHGVNIGGDVSGSNIIVGDSNTISQHITNVYGNTPPSVEEKAELERLRELVAKKIKDLKPAIEPRGPAGGNPYHALEALDVYEGDLLVGRASALDRIIASLEGKGYAVLTGKKGIGKTSLLRAGLIPRLANAGHWPIRIEVGGEAVEATIKKAILGSLEGFPRLAAHPLRDVLELASAFLPGGKDIVLLVDNVEDVFQQQAEAQNKFASVWKECVNDPALNARWVLCLPELSARFNQFQSDEINPFAHLLILGPLDREATLQAILQPAQAAGIKFEEKAAQALADGLLANEATPARLQLACSMLALGRSEITLADYEKADRVDGLLQAYLDQAIRQLSTENHQAAWQILSLLEEEDKPIAARTLEQTVSSFGYRVADFESLLGELKKKQLIIPEEAGYRLDSDSWKAPIREWRKREAIPRQIQKEVAVQLEQIRNSVLRGLVGGALGLGLFRWIVGNPIPDITAALFLTLLYATVGGLIGLLLTFFVDISAALRTGAWTRYLIGGFGGAAAFGLALALFVYLSIPSENPLADSFLSALVGGVWGAAAGLGIAWGMNSARPAWMVMLIVPIVSGLALFAANGLIPVLTRSQPLEVLLGGWVFPFCIAIGARLGRRAGGQP